MIMDKLYQCCANNQKTGDLEWELMPSALESMVVYSIRDFSRWVLFHQWVSFLANIHVYPLNLRHNFHLFEVHPDFEIVYSLKLKSFKIQILLLVQNLLRK